MDGKAIRVVVVDDNECVRKAIRLLLLGNDDIEHVGGASDGRKALAMCAQLQPDVVIMDAKMPGMDGITATRSIKASYPAVKVVVLTTFYDKGLEHRALQAGASACLDKAGDGDRLTNAIRTAHAECATLPSATEEGSLPED
jgi:DNA-binding NarL/FixJ family response regulator